MNFAERRKQVFEKMERQSALILFSGIESHVSADEYAPFEADRNFFYLTGLRRDHMILLMKKTLKEEQVILFIEEADPTQERWYGRNTEFSNKRIQQAGIVKSQPILCIRRIKKDITEYEIFEYWWSGCHRRRDDEE